MNKPHIYLKPYPNHPCKAFWVLHNPSLPYYKQTPTERELRNKAYAWCAMQNLKRSEEFQNKLVMLLVSNMKPSTA